MQTENFYHRLPLLVLVLVLPLQVVLLLSLLRDYCRYCCCCCSSSLPSPSKVENLQKREKYLEVRNHTSSLSFAV